MLNPSAWLAAYHQAWITHDAEQLAQLFTEDAAYHSHPFRPPYQGRAAIQAYWQSATASQADLELRWGAPVIADKHMAVEWWAMMRDTEAGDLTLPGCLLVRFAEDGLCEELREYWHLEMGSRILPPVQWGN
jgi:hypothetical protein